MTLLIDQSDPTTALFMSVAGGNRAADLVYKMYPSTVTKCSVQPRVVRGQHIGYQCIAHKTDGSSAPITNSDFERLEQ